MKNDVNPTGDPTGYPSPTDWMGAYSRTELEELCEEQRILLKDNDVDDLRRERIIKELKESNERYADYASMWNKRSLRLTIELQHANKGIQRLQGKLKRLHVKAKFPTCAKPYCTEPSIRYCSDHE